MPHGAKEIKMGKGTKTTKKKNNQYAGYCVFILILLFIFAALLCRIPLEAGAEFFLRLAGG